MQFSLISSVVTLMLAAQTAAAPVSLHDTRFCAPSFGKQRLIFYYRQPRLPMPAWSPVLLVFSGAGSITVTVLAVHWITSGRTIGAIVHIRIANKINWATGSTRSALILKDTATTGMVGSGMSIASRRRRHMTVSVKAVDIAFPDNAILLRICASIDRATTTTASVVWTWEIAKVERISTAKGMYLSALIASSSLISFSVFVSVRGQKC